MSAKPENERREEIARTLYEATPMRENTPARDNEWRELPWEEIEANWPDRAARAYREADAILARQTGEPEPVAKPWAWMKRWTDPKEGPGPNRVRVDLNDKVEAWMQDCTVTPLYEHPPAPAEAQARVEIDPEALARWIDREAFVSRRRSSRNQHAANLAQTRARKLAKQVLRFAPLAALLSPSTPKPARVEIAEEMVEHMVKRFLSWKLPENFRPDGGVSFVKIGNSDTEHPYVREPFGTNVLDAAQAGAMVRHMIEGLPR